MNILYINHYAGGLKYGMEFRTYYLSREWVKNGHNVRIVAGDYSHVRTANPDVKIDFQMDVVDGIEYKWIKSGEYKGNGIGRLISMIRFIGKLNFCIEQITEGFKPDVVISSSTYPLDTFPARKIANHYGAKYVHEVHDMWPITPIELYGMSKWHPFVVVMQMGEDYFCRNADKVVSILPCAKEYFIQHGMKADKFVHVPNGINLEDWSSVAEVPESYISKISSSKKDGRFVIGFFGSHTKSYNLDILLHALSKCDQSKLYVAFLGNGNYKDYLIGLAKKLKLDEKCYDFFDSVPKKSIPSFTALLDACYIGAKRNRMFSFGIGMNKLFDSMMSGKPLLYAVDAPNNYVTEYNCGISVEAENIDALAAGIDELLRLEPEKLKEMGNNGKQAVLDKFNYEALAKEFLRALI